MSNVNRILEDIEKLKNISEKCESGTTRIGFTSEYRQGVDYFKSRMMQAGLTVREDAIGNIYGRLEGEDKTLPVILSGSHLDTVRCAGAYDGICGAVCALEVARMLKENGISLRHSYEVIGIIEEEGTRFGQVLLGSKFITGDFSQKDLNSIIDSDGASLREVRSKYSNQEFSNTIKKDEEIAAFIELHDEQGPVLESKGIDIGIVNSIVAISWMTITVEGFAGHAGTVPMPLRQDALTASAEMIHRISDYTTTNYPYTATATIGKIEVLPGSSNCIPSKSTFTIDLRSGLMQNIDFLTAYIKELSDEIAKKYGVNISVQVNSRQCPVNMNTKLQEVLKDSCKELDYSYMDLNSGAGHDSMIMAKHYPTAMLFIPCVKGITHNPQEYVNTEFLEKGTNVLYKTIIELDKKL